MFDRLVFDRRTQGVRSVSEGRRTRKIDISSSVSVCPTNKITDRAVEHRTSDKTAASLFLKMAITMSDVDVEEQNHILIQTSVAPLASREVKGSRQALVRLI